MPGPFLPGTPIPGGSAVDSWHQGPGPLQPLQRPSPGVAPNAHTRQQEATQHWIGNRIPIQFLAPPYVGANAIYGNLGPLTNPTVIARGQWASPIFDLDPNLPDRPTGIYEEAIPISAAKTAKDWLSGKANLRVTIGGLETLSAQILVYSYEETAMVNPQNMRVNQSRQEITMAALDGSFKLDTLNGTSTSNIYFHPAGDRVRFWRVRVVFDLIAGAFPGDVPNLYTEGYCF